MTLKLRRRMESFIQSGYYGKMSFKVYEALRGVGFASLFLLLTPITEYKCKDIFNGTEIVCATKDKKNIFTFSKTGDKEEEAARKRYMKAKGK